MSEKIEQSVPAKVRQPRRISPFWLLPIVAFMVGMLLFFQILREQGEKITIRFNEGDGLSAGKTLIRYQGLQIGQVKKVYFVDDLKKVEVMAEINAEAKSILKEGTKFWVVKPSASLAGVSGIDALVSGNYITLLPSDDPDAKSQYEFIAEDEPPTVSVADGDKLIRLISNDLGSLTVGASVYFRKVPVGRIADYRFTDEQKKVEVDLVIEKKYANLVKQNSRFWNISGINVDASFQKGLNINMDSLASVVQGAVAFDSPENAEVAEQGQRFELFENLKSAQRGIEVKVLVPIMPNLKVNETAVFHENMQIGTLVRLQMPNQENSDIPKGMFKGTLLIDPNHTELMRSGTRILLREPNFALNKEQISKIGELFRGLYFDVTAGGGEPKLEFNVQKEEDYLLSLPNIVPLVLTAPQSFGVDKGQGIYYNDIQIGQILKRELQLDKVTFQAIIFPPYRHLVTADSKFIAISNLDVNLGLDGLRVQAGSPSDWLKGGVRILAGKSGEPKKSYPLYKDLDSAENGIITAEKTATLTLSAKEVGGIDKGSVVLYRNFQIGEILKITPKKEHFDVALFIEPAYRHLLTEKSRFWIEPATQVDISPNGLSVQAAPLMRTLKGAISLDNKGAKNDKILHSSYQKANAGKTYINLTAKDGSKLNQGMPIKYMGLKIGNVESLTLDNANKQIKVRAFIEGEYYPIIAKSGSVFRAVSPEVDTTGFKNLDAALQNYISVEAGSGKHQWNFALSDSHSKTSQYGNGFPIIVETTDADGITPDAPVLYRGMQVGIVDRLSLSELGDRVFIHLKIENKHKHLVRKNSEFWAASGYTMEMSLSGISMNSGTMSQLFNGGISFSTPSGKVVQPQAEANRHFRLQRRTPDGAESWNMGIAQ